MPEGHRLRARFGREGGGEGRQPGGVRLEFGLVRPVSHGEAREEGGAERRRLDAGGTLHGHADDVALELHQEIVRGGAAVHAQGGEPDSGVLLHRLEHVRRLVGEGFERRAHDVVAVDAAREAEHGAARVLVPVRRAESGERGHHEAAVRVRDGAGHGLGVAGLLQQAQFVAQPLDGGAGREHAALERVVHLAAEPPRDRGEQSVLRGHATFARVHQHEAACAVGVLRVARREAGLAEEGALLIAGHAGHGDGGVEDAGCRFAEHAARGAHLRENAARNVQFAENVVAPLQGADVVHHRARGVGIVRRVHAPAGEVPQEPRVNGAEEQASGLGGGARAGHVLENPAQLGA